MSMKIKMRVSRRRRARQLTKLLSNIEHVNSVMHTTALMREFGGVRDGQNIHSSVQEALAVHELTAHQTAWHEFERIQKQIDSPEFHHHYNQKVNAFQHEVERALSANATRDIATQAAEIKKADAFMRLREQNYAASLLLEGLHPAPHSALTTLTALHAKYAG